MDANSVLIKQSIKLGIPVIGVLSNTSNPLGIQYPIIGNNDSSKALYLYLKFLIKTISSGKEHESKKVVGFKKLLYPVKKVKKVKNKTVYKFKPWNRNKNGKQP